MTFLNADLKPCCIKGINKKPTPTLRLFPTSVHDNAQGEQSRDNVLMTASDFNKRKLENLQNLRE